jgi:hypothetical protein
VSGNEPKFHGNHLSWEVEKTDRTFRVYVVEPDAYSPASHAAIFNAALNALIALKSDRLDPYEQQSIRSERPIPFDLVTFPEAFLPSTDLLVALNSLGNWPRFGCIHLGLRPTTDVDQHLFTVEELRKLLAAIRLVPRVVENDLSKFSSWLDQQNYGFKFNIGCVFTVDATRDVRICLHPKVVRSKSESSALPEHNMSEANLLSLVTLRPANKNLKTVTLQPLLCSDALDLSTDNGEPGPLEAVNKQAEILGANPPDHIDVVSVATCTPQTMTISGKGERYFVWHEQFKNSFLRAATNPGLPRHHFSTFVLANFGLTPEKKIAGLSGTFMPVPLREDTPLPFVTLSCWGKPNKESENQWSSPGEDYATLMTWTSRSYLAYLERMVERADATGRMFGFTVHRFPRDVIPIAEKTGLANCSYWVAQATSGVPPYSFKEAPHG